MEKIRQFSSCKLIILYNSLYIEFFCRIALFKPLFLTVFFLTFPFLCLTLSSKRTQVAERAAACGVPPLLEQAQKTRLQHNS